MMDALLETFAGSAAWFGIGLSLVIFGDYAWRRWRSSGYSPPPTRWLLVIAGFMLLASVVVVLLDPLGELLQRYFPERVLMVMLTAGIVLCDWGLVRHVRRQRRRRQTY